MVRPPRGGEVGATAATSHQIQNLPKRIGASPPGEARGRQLEQSEQGWGEMLQAVTIFEGGQNTGSAAVIGKGAGGGVGVHTLMLTHADVCNLLAILITRRGLRLGAENPRMHAMRGAWSRLPRAARSSWWSPNLHPGNPQKWCHRYSLSRTSTGSSSHPCR